MSSFHSKMYNIVLHIKLFCHKTQPMFTILLFLEFLLSATKSELINTAKLLKMLHKDKKPVTYSKEDSKFTKCAVSTEVPICSDVGVKVLKRGGNAMDAAIASALCVGVINSFSSGLGGGGFILVRKPSKNGDIVEMIDFRETAPNKIMQAKLKSEDATKLSGTAVGVPGEVKGFKMAHEKYGKLKWKELFTETIEIAKEFTASDHLCKRLKKLQPYIFGDEGLKEIFTRDGKLVEKGEKISRMNYANTLCRIAIDPEDFYSGEVAKRIIRSIKKNGGVMELDDLNNYEAISREALKGNYREYTVFSTNLPTSGMFILQALNIMEKFDIKEIARVGVETKQFPQYHLLIEIFKFMAAKRGELADPDFLKGWEKVVKEIISDDYAKAIVDKIDFNSVLAPEEYGRVFDSVDDHGTTHLNVVDEDEMFVLLTSTVNLEFGAKFMDKETGIIFNDEMDDFYVPNVTNAFDLDKMAKNIVEPNKRPFSSAAPVLMIKDSEIIALGAAGGTRIPTSIFSVIFHIILGKSLSEAIMESRLHDQLVPTFTYIESNLDKEIRDYLRLLGHNVAVSSQNSIFTSVQGIRLEKLKNGEKRIEAFSDKRKGGMSSGI